MAMFRAHITYKHLQTLYTNLPLRISKANLHTWKTAPGHLRRLQLWSAEHSAAPLVTDAAGEQPQWSVLHCHQYGLYPRGRYRGIKAN